MGTARRRDPPGRDARRPPPRLRAPPGGPPVHPRRRDHGRGRGGDRDGEGRRGGAAGAALRPGARRRRRCPHAGGPRGDRPLPHPGPPRPQGGAGRRMIEAVLLDVGGVLVLPEPAGILPAVRAAGAADATAEDLARGHYAGVAAMDRMALARGVSADWPGSYRPVAGELPLPAALLAKVVEALRVAYTDLAWTGTIPGAVDALRRLAATGVAI